MAREGVEIARMKTKPKTPTKPRVKPGTSKSAAATRKALFREAYLQNGGNGTDAAITAGFSPRSAAQQATRMLKDAKLSAEINARKLLSVRAAEAITDLSIERTVREVARIAYFDPRRLFGPDGKLKAVAELDDDVAAALASIEVDEDGVIKIKLCSKDAALDKAMRFHGLYAKDNTQRGDPAIAALLAAVGLGAGKFTVKR
jgi:phage terminase small subunit